MSYHFVRTTAAFRAAIKADSVDAPRIKSFARENMLSSWGSGFRGIFEAYAPRNAKEFYEWPVQCDMCGYVCMFADTYTVHANVCSICSALIWEVSVFRVIVSKAGTVDKWLIENPNRIFSAHAENVAKWELEIMPIVSAVLAINHDAITFIMKTSFEAAPYAVFGTLGLFHEPEIC